MNRTPLYDLHLKAGAELGPIFGYAMPLEYPAGSEAEYWATRRRVSLCDVGFMTKIAIGGPEAMACLQYLATADLAQMAIDRLKYAPICDQAGIMIDNVIITKTADNEFLTVFDKADSWPHLARLAADFQVWLENVSVGLSILSVQGPHAKATLQKLTSVDLNDLGFYQSAMLWLGGRKIRLSHMGYTGGAGYELTINSMDIRQFWNLIHEAGQQYGLLPCGYRAAEDMRIEGGFISLDRENGNPFENGLGRTVSFTKGDFMGREFLRKALAGGLKKTLIWLEVEAGATLRTGDIIDHDFRVIGEITSYGQSWLKKIGLAMGYVCPEYAVAGVQYHVQAAEGRVPGRLSLSSPVKINP